MSKAWRYMTKAAEAKMVKNHERAANDESCLDETPVIKLFTPWGAATWWLWEYNPEDRMFFGLADLGMGTSELGYVSRDELEALRGPWGLRVERDMYTSLNETFREMLGW